MEGAARGERDGLGCAQGLRHPWHDHPTSPEYLSYHEQRWATEDAAQSLRNPGLGLPPGYDDDDHAPSAGEQRA